MGKGWAQLWLIDYRPIGHRWENNESSEVCEIIKPVQRVKFNR